MHGRAAAGTSFGVPQLLAWLTAEDTSRLRRLVWGLASSLGFLNHWISVCSSLQLEILRLGKGVPSGHPQVAGGDTQLVALQASCDSTLQAGLCSN